MRSIQLDFKKVNRYIPHICLIGVGIGTANYIIHGELNWFQWVFQSVSTSFLIGFTLVWVASNKSWFQHFIKPWWKLYMVLSIVFFLVGTIASEIELIVKTLIFLNEGYQPFSSGSMYLSNGVIAMFLGFSFFLNDRLFPNETLKTNKDPEALAIQKETSVPITKIPVKQGEGIQLIRVEEVVYFEAYDNYSFLYDVSGKKMLCDYSLIFLEKRLDENFSRIHRKYIVNTVHIKQIIPHLNGRYIIQFDTAKLNSITSSKGHLTTMRKLVKIE